MIPRPMLLTMALILPVGDGDGIADRRTCVGRGCRLCVTIYLLESTLRLGFRRLFARLEQCWRGAPLRLPRTPKSSIPAPTQDQWPADVIA